MPAITPEPAPPPGHLMLDATRVAEREAQRTEDGATALPGWFASGDEHLFAWLHLPPAGTVRGSVVICPPVFFEQLLTHATLRHLAEELAANGFAALRFDYRATGDSSGSPPGVQDVDTWTDDITAAVTHLRGRDASWVAVVGMRFGANLVAAASERSGADACVLWDPLGSGRSFVRAATLLHHLSVAGGHGTAARGAAPVPDQTDLGFDYPPAFVESMRRLTLDALSPNPRTVVFTPSGELPSALRGRQDLEARTAIGQAELVDRPIHFGRIPTVTSSEIVAWLGDAAGRGDRLDRTRLAQQIQIEAPGGATIVERTVRLGDIGLFGIASGPEGQYEDPAALTCLFINTSVQYHIGPHRLWVDVTRDLAGAGMNAVRLDFSGIGDSPRRLPYAPAETYSLGTFDDMDAMLNDFGDRPVAMVGLSSGAYHVLEAAARHELRGVLSIHLGLDFWDLNNHPTGRDPRRIVVATDRPWLRRLLARHLAASALWRLPGIGWRALDRIGLQPDIGLTILRAIGSSTEVVMVIEEQQLGWRRAWAFGQRRTPPNLNVIPSQADHSVMGSADRAEVAELIFAQVSRWAQLPTDANN